MILDQNTFADPRNRLEIASRSGAFLLVDKDKDWTSFDVVAKLRNSSGAKKVGHAGTLDPLATGLLILAFGKATKSIEKFADLKKKYRAVAKLGAVTKTDDAEAPEENVKSLDSLNPETVTDALKSFVGEIDQIPPMYSAKKVKGRRLYKLARKNETIEREPSRVTVHAIDIIKVNLPVVEFEVECSKGTYVRALARDLGGKLGVGGYLADLRRTAIGEYSVDLAVDVQTAADGFAETKEQVIKLRKQ